MSAHINILQVKLTLEYRVGAIKHFKYSHRLSILSAFSTCENNKFTDFIYLLIDICFNKKK